MVNRAIGCTVVAASILVSGVPASVPPAARAGANEVALPRYALTPGTVLVYEGKELADTPTARMGVDRRTELTVAKANADGSWRVIVVQRQQRYMDRKNGARTDYPERAERLVVDVHPDGRIPQRAEDSQGILNRMLPELPATEAEARAGWSFEAADVRASARMLEREADEPSVHRFAVEPTSPMWAMNGFAATMTYRLDPARGLITAVDGQHRVRGRDTRTETERLVEVRTLPPDEAAGLAADIDVVADAESAYARELDAAFTRCDEREAKARLDAALAALEHARAETTGSPLSHRLDAVIGQHRASGEGFRQRVAQSAPFIGRPAPPWSLVDLEGAPHRLEDYAGKVVVLDFWYRNCGWCIRAMPQLVRLTARYAGRPVAVLGMNTDANLEDARYVEATVGLNYPSLRADRALVAAHGIRAFPTLVVIDRRGRIRCVHRGYSGTLADDLGALIDRLLAEDAERP